MLEGERSGVVELLAERARSVFTAYIVRDEAVSYAESEQSGRSSLFR